MLRKKKVKGPLMLGMNGQRPQSERPYWEKNWKGHQCWEWMVKGHKLKGHFEKKKGWKGQQSWEFKCVSIIQV
jgi:hypothetical protein